MHAVPAAVLLHLNAFTIIELVFLRNVITTLTLLTSKRNQYPLIILSHKTDFLLFPNSETAGNRLSNQQFSTSLTKEIRLCAAKEPRRKLAKASDDEGDARSVQSGYFKIFVTRPAPTVRPPSRMAKRRPSSIAIGLPSSTVISMLSPGITISVPSGS